MGEEGKDITPLESIDYDRLCTTVESATELVAADRDSICNMAPATTCYPKQPIDYAGIAETLKPGHPTKAPSRLQSWWFSKSFESLPEYAALLHDVVCFGDESDSEHQRGNTFIAHDRFILPDSYVFRGQRRPLPSELRTISDQGKEVLSLNVEVTDIPAEPGLHYLGGQAHTHFGHFVLEGLSRLWLYGRLPEAVRDELRFVLYNNPDRDPLLPWQIDFFEGLGIAKDRLVTLTEPKRFERMIVPSSSYNLFTSVADAQAETWEHVGRALGRKGGPDRVYLSRAQFPYNQRVANETEVEQRFRNWGFTVVYPEQHTIPEQISLIRDARYVAGNAGSAMYLSAFARPGVNKLVIAPLIFAFRDDQLISHVRGDAFSYFLCQPGSDTSKGPRKTVYHVALERLDEAIAQWSN